MTRMSLVTWRVTACPEHWQELSVGEVPAEDERTTGNAVPPPPQPLGRLPNRPAANEAQAHRAVGIDLQRRGSRNVRAGGIDGPPGLGRLRSVHEKELCAGSLTQPLSRTLQRTGGPGRIIFGLAINTGEPDLKLVHRGSTPGMEVG